MKKRLLAALLCGTLMLGGTALPVMADGMKVVTLGADLNDAQRQTMMNYFKANANEVQILYITNQDERNHLGAYVPLEQIGTRTLSCAYVKPTTSGGIRVRTANLNYVTGNMIASTLTTSGVTNCEVIAACPFEVSGTGALTGIQMAYERASGTTLDPVKKDLAAQEIVVTGNVASTAGNNDATMLVNNAKREVLQNNVTNVQEITNIVNNIVTENNININETTVIQVVDLLVNISEQDYDYEEMAPTLDAVSENVEEVVEVKTGTPEDTAQAGYEEPEYEEPEYEEPEYDEDSIFNDIDEYDLGENVPVSSTDDPALEAVTYDPSVELGESVEQKQDDTFETGNEFGIPEADESVFNPDGTESSVPAETTDDTNAEDPFFTDDTWEQPAEYEDSQDFTEEDGWEIFNGDGSDQTYTEEQPFETEIPGAEEQLPGTENQLPGTEDQPFAGDAEGAAGTETAGSAEQALMSRLSEQAKSEYEEVQKFCRIEFENDQTSISSKLEAGYRPSYVVEDKELGKALSTAVSGKFLEILANGTATYVPDGTEKYLDPNLNMIVDYLEDLFGNDPTKVPTLQELMKKLTEADKALLLDDCIKYFEKYYGESTEAPVPEEQPENTEESEAPEYEEQYQEPAEYTEYSDGGYTEEYYGDGGYTDDSYSYDDGYYTEDTGDYGIPEGTDEYY